MKLIYLLFFFSAPLSAENPESFRVGVILPLSGPLAEYGVATRNGIQMALHEKPQAFSHIKFIYEDDQYDNKKTVAAFNKLQAVDSADLVYVWGSGPSSAVAPIADKNKFPLIAMAIDPAPAIGRNSVIRFANYSGQYVDVLLNYLRAHKLRNFGVVVTQIAYTESMLDALRKRLSKDETLTILHSLNPGDSDFKASVLKIKNTKVDALGVYLMSRQLVPFYRELRSHKITTATFGTDFFESKTEIQNSGGLMSGAVYPNNVVQQWFSDKYIGQFANDIQITFAANGYDFARLLSELFPVNQGTVSPQDIIKQFESTSKRDGASGVFHFSNSDEGGKFFDFPIVMREIISQDIRTLN